MRMMMQQQRQLGRRWSAPAGLRSYGQTATRGCGEAAPRVRAPQSESLQAAKPSGPPQQCSRPTPVPPPPSQAAAAASAQRGKRRVENKGASPRAKSGDSQVPDKAHTMS